MKLGSLFDGIGGWLLAALHNGVKPVWSSEIDDFPATVTAHHFPEVKQLGDITKIDVDSLEPVDIICAGSPCQDLSVAGKRAGLEGERSGLFRTAIRLVHELRARTGKPRYFVWENVPGAFSSNKGLDFRAVLEEISQTEIPMPKDNKWAESGMVEWDSGSLAWRTLDAQYWGVPQRRKRIFLVADFAGQSAGEILFVEQSSNRHFKESTGEREEAAGNARESADSASGFKYRQGAKAGGIGYQNGKAPTLELSQNCAIYDMTHADEVMRPVHGDKSNCLNGRMGTGGNQVPVVQCLNDQGGSVMDVSDKAGTRRAQSHGHEPIVHTICGNIIGRENQNGGHQMGVGKDVSFTLNTVDRHAVFPQKAYDEFSEGKPLATLKASGGNYGGEREFNNRKVGALMARDYKGIGNQDLESGWQLVIDDVYKDS